MRIIKKSQFVKWKRELLRFGEYRGKRRLTVRSEFYVHVDRGSLIVRSEFYLDRQGSRSSSFNSA